MGLMDQAKAAVNQAQAAKPAGENGTANPGQTGNPNDPKVEAERGTVDPDKVSYMTPHSPALKVKVGGKWHKGAGHVLTLSKAHAAELDELMASGRSDLAQMCIKMKSPEEAAKWFLERNASGSRPLAQQGPTSSLLPNQTPTGAVMKDPHAPIMVEIEKVPGQSEAQANVNSGNADHLKAAAQ